MLLELTNTLAAFNTFECMLCVTGFDVRVCAFVYVYSCVCVCVCVRVCVCMCACVLEHGVTYMMTTLFDPCPL